jgi:excinuclease ABC subunit A
MRWVQWYSLTWPNATASYKLVEKGNTVLVIEHNLDVVKTADWIVDMAPDGGGRGGNIVVEGTPETVVKKKGSFTGVFLKHELLAS